MGKAAPEPLEAVGAAHASGRGREDQVVRAALGVQEAVPQLLAHGDIPHPGGGLGGLDGLGAAFNGLVDVDLVAVEVDVLPGKRRRLAGGSWARARMWRRSAAVMGRWLRLVLSGS